MKAHNDYELAEVTDTQEDCENCIFNIPLNHQHHRLCHTPHYRVEEYDCNPPNNFNKNTAKFVIRHKVIQKELSDANNIALVNYYKD